MSLTVVLLLFLTHLGIGITLTLLLVSKEAGVKFFRFNAVLILTLLLIGLAFRSPYDLASELSNFSTLALALCFAAVFLFRLIIGRIWPKLRPVLLWTATLSGFMALMLQALDVSSGTPLGMQVLTVASFFTSAALLGGACTAMILGHWYLILPSMDVTHLQGIVKFHIGSIGLRIVVVAAAVYMAIAGFESFVVPGFQRYIFSVSGVFFWQRVLFGLLGPVVLSYLTWETAKIRSTQSATGILYVDFFTVIVGEALAKYLVLSTRVPV